jgi:hypothetical protein
MDEAGYRLQVQSLLAAAPEAGRMPAGMRRALRVCLIFAGVCAAAILGLIAAALLLLRN